MVFYKGKLGSSKRETGFILQFAFFLFLVKMKTNENFCQQSVRGCNGKCEGGSTCVMIDFGGCNYVDEFLYLEPFMEM